MLKHISILLNGTRYSPYIRDVLTGIYAYAATTQHWALTAVDADATGIADARWRRAAGVLTYLNTDPKHLADLRSLAIPIVNFSGVDQSDFGFARVMIDHTATGRSAAQHLIDRGMQRFGVYAPWSRAAEQTRTQSYIAHLAAAGYPVAVFNDFPDATAPTPDGWPVHEDAIRRWLADLPKPIGIMASTDAYALTLLEVCRLSGVRVPEEVMVIGVLNDQLLCSLSHPALSSVDTNSQRIGYEAAAWLDRMIGGASFPPHDVVIPPLGVIARASTEAPPGKDADVESALRFIRSRANAGLTIEDVVAHVPLSRRTLERRFRAVKQCTIAEAILSAQMDAAQGLLTTTTLPIWQIAQRCGFGTASYFSAAFRAATGSRPTQFRRRQQSTTQNG
jgi:LacI family transcriptional regulator